MPRRQEVDFDKILHEIGDFGRYQQCFYALLCLAITIATVPGVVALVFQAYVPKYRCLVPGCDNASAPAYDEPFVGFAIPASDAKCRRFWKYNLTVDSCLDKDFDDNITVSCTRFVFDRSMFTSSFVTQWNLTCSYQSLVELPNTMYFLGVLLGSLVCGIISDRFGRKVALMVTILLINVANYLVVALRFSFVSVCALRVLIGLASTGMFQTAFVLAVELVGKQWRVPCGTIINYFTSMGGLIAGGLGYAVRDWVTLQLISTGPLVLLFAGFYLCPESVRWLLIQGRKAEAGLLIRRMALRNGATLSPHLLADTDDDSDEEEGQGLDGAPPPQLTVSQHSQLSRRSQRSQRSAREEDEAALVPAASTETFVDCMYCRELQVRLALALIGWFSVNLAFYGMVIDLPNMPGDFFTNVFVTTAAEMPGYTLCWLGMDRIGRRATFVTATGLGGLALIVAGLIPNEMAVANAVMLMLGKCGAAGSFAVIYIYTSELFPTSARNTAVGLCSTVGRVAALLAPQVAVLAMYGESIPLLIIGGVVVVSGMFALCLPETLGIPLPETKQDVLDQIRYTENVTALVLGLIVNGAMLSEINM